MSRDVERSLSTRIRNGAWERAADDKQKPGASADSTKLFNYGENLKFTSSTDQDTKPLVWFISFRDLLKLER